MKLRGIFELWTFFDVAEKINYPGAKGMTPAVERDGERRILLYECGVVAVEQWRDFEGDWETTGKEFREWMRSGAALEAEAILDRHAAAIEGRYADFGREDYAVLVLPSGEGLRERRGELACLVRGEEAPLAEDEVKEVWAGAISYHADDLVVVGWEAAVVAGGDEEVISLLRYANVQLLEFRRYDAELGARLGAGYGELRRWNRWRLRGKAEEIYRMLIDLREAAERVDGAVAFLSDTYAARVYRLAAGRIGVDDYRRMVEGKMRVAQEVYRFMVDEFHHTRAFVLEATVVGILLIDLYYLLRGKL